MAKHCNSLVFANIRNGLNGFQFKNDIPPDELQIIVQAYSSANAATYDAFIWENIAWGKRSRFVTTNKPASHAQQWFSTSFSHTTFTPGPQPTERNHPFFDDTSIEGLQRRRVLFLACHQSTHALSSSASTSGRNPDEKSVNEIVAEFRQHYLPGVIETLRGLGNLFVCRTKGIVL